MRFCRALWLHALRLCTLRFDDGTGLPQADAYETVLRDALAVDAADPCGVYFGTRSGKLFASADEGETWQTLAEGLPPIVAVKVVAA